MKPCARFYQVIKYYIDKSIPASSKIRQFKQLLCETKLINDTMLKYKKLNRSVHKTHHVSIFISYEPAAE